MLPLFAGLLFTFQDSQPYPDRANFLHVLARLADGTPRAEILKSLGKPDRIEIGRGYEGNKVVPEETWLYGTDSPTGAATLARFTVYDGKLAYHPVSETSPPISVISEADLRKGMHIVLDSFPKEQSNGNKDISAWVVRVVNALLPFGEAKCKAIIGECGRLMEGYGQLDPCPYFLCYSLFDPPAKPGYFDIFGPVWYSPAPHDHLAHPRWPVEIVDNTPIIRGKPMGGFGGYAPTFISEYKKLRDRIHIRKSPLSSPK